MSSLLENMQALGKRGLLASHAGFGNEELAALRRHAAREESRGEIEAAADGYRTVALLEPGEASNWDGLARCWRAMRDPRATDVQRIADAVRGRFA